MNEALPFVSLESVTSVMVTYTLDAVKILDCREAGRCNCQDKKGARVIKVLNGHGSVLF